MAYTPELSKKYSAMLRRIAWSMNIPMTKAIEHVFDRIVPEMNCKMICDACREPKNCDECPFQQP